MYHVALRKESVDRNDVIRPAIDVFLVALRKESVDRNDVCHPAAARPSMSLSARRAWIEMDWASVITAMTSVALRKESVDRNYIIKITATPPAGRSPQGERG